MSTGLLKWLLDKLKVNNFDDYCLEYGTSLLMNLILHTEPNFWDGNAATISSVLIKLLNTENNEVIIFLNYTRRIYSHLASKVVLAVGKVYSTILES